jgi:hypothetical protein
MSLLGCGSDVSEERAASIFRVEKVLERREAAARRTQRHIPEDGSVQSQRRDDLKTCTVPCVVCDAL